MLKHLLKRRSSEADVAAPLYAQIVAQARRPEFYSIFEVPDTVDGRFDVLILHAVLFFRRLKGEGSDARALSQSVFDTMFADLDQNIRELGASDVTVGKKVQKMASAFYGRAAAYDAALDRYEDRPQDLQDALRRNIFPETEVDPRTLQAFARHVHECALCLDGNAVEEIVAGRVVFADPAASTVGGYEP